MNSPEYYAVVAQIIPVLLLAYVFEARTLDDAAADRTPRSLLLYGLILGALSELILLGGMWSSDDGHLVFDVVAVFGPSSLLGLLVARVVIRLINRDRP